MVPDTTATTEAPPLVVPLAVLLFVFFPPLSSVFVFDGEGDDGTTISIAVSVSVRYPRCNYLFVF